MDFLDSLDLEIDNKSQRVRSWYLYEQFREIEKNQLDAAKKLKEKSHQDKILRQELAERRVRRNLYDQSETCGSESRLHNGSRFGDDSVLSPTEDMFESVADIHDESLYDFGDDLSRVDFVVGNCFKEDNKSVEDYKDCNSCADSIRCIKTIESDDNFRNEAKEMFTNEKFDNISKFTDSNYNCNETRDITKMVDGIVSEVSSLVSVNNYDEHCDQSKNSGSEIALFDFWRKLVSFAYQIIKLNHGNCFYDYSSQFMTAVLICDVLRKGICKICDILQPYVSPIKFADDNDDASLHSKKHKNREKLENMKKSMIFLKCTPESSAHELRFKRNCDSEKYSCYCHKYLSYEKNIKSEPWRSIPKLSIPKTDLKKEPQNRFIRPECSRKCNLPSCEVCECRYRKNSNPMLKIAECMDDFVKLDNLRHI